MNTQGFLLNLDLGSKHYMAFPLLWNFRGMGEFGMTHKKCIDEYVNKPNLLKVTSLASIPPNSMTVDLGLEPLIMPTL